MNLLRKSYWSGSCWSLASESSRFGFVEWSYLDNSMLTLPLGQRRHGLLEGWKTRIRLLML
jgi:hypothetical protein